MDDKDGPRPGRSNWRRFVAELSAIVVAAVLCASVSNFLAGRERKLTLPGQYPNALAVPAAPEVSAASATLPARGPEPAPAPAGIVPVPGPKPASPVPAPTLAARPVRPAASRSAPAPGLAPGQDSTVADLAARFPPHPDRISVDVSGEDALLAQGRGVPFLDARRTKVFEEGHIAGARSFPVWEADIDQRVVSLLNEGRGLDLPIVVYCSGGECEDSHMLAEKLFGVGFVNVLVYSGGWPDWLKRGGPVRTGSAP